MAELVPRVYPNPSSDETWTDEHGRVWHRRGERRDRFDITRVRRLLRSDGVLLVTWWAGEVQWFDDATKKQAGADALYRDASHPDDIEPSEWRSEDGGRMLLLEHHC